MESANLDCCDGRLAVPGKEEVRYITDHEIPETLSQMARQIERWADHGDYRVIEAAMKLRALRRRIEAGEAGRGIKWFTWARANIKLSKSRICELQLIADSTDPNAAVEKLRSDVRDRVRKHRQKEERAKRMLEPDRRAMMEWLRDASIQDVSMFWRQISRGIALRHSD